MGDMAIFKQATDVTTVRAGKLSSLAQSMASAAMSRRIQTNINGTFKRIVNGEVIGNAIRGEINVIIVAALPKVSRVFYKEQYDPNKEATLPNCWSNLGDRPEEAASDPQSATCADCPQNIKGSGQNGGRACRFQRRIAVLVEGDKSGEIYQFNVPAKSLFGKGSGNVHPFESYVKYLIANGVSPDGVVTNISYDMEADTMELVFSPLRPITDEEFAMVEAAQAHPDSERYIKLTVAQADGVSKPPVQEEAPKPKVTRSEEPDDEEEEEEVKAPVKRKSKKEEAPAPAKKSALADVISEWEDE